MTDEPPSLKPIADAIESAIKGADAAPVNVVQIDSKRRGRRKRGSEVEPNVGDFSVDDINRDHSLVLMGSKAVVIKENARGPIEDRQRVLTIDGFSHWFGNRFTEVRDQKGAVKSVTYAQAWLRSQSRRQYAGIEFYPDPHNVPGTPGYLNLWRGFGVRPGPKANGWKTLRDHMLVNVCGADERLFEWVFGFFAHIVQRPRERIGVALVLQGRQGSGKTIVGQHFGALFPVHYFLVDDPRYVVGNFNVHMANCLLLQADGRCGLEIRPQRVA